MNDRKAVAAACSEVMSATEDCSKVGTGHHLVIRHPENGDWFVVYHRRPRGHADPNHREICMDRMEFDEDGYIKPIRITAEGIGSVPLHAAKKP